MKKLLIVSGIALVSASSFSETKNNLYIKAGADILSRYTKAKLNVADKFDDINSNSTRGLGFEFAVEGTRNISEHVELGMGVAYQDHANTKKGCAKDVTGNNYTTESYKSIPVYTTFKYNFLLESEWKPYVRADLGYSFNHGTNGVISSGGYYFNAKAKNGLYWGIGVGAEYNNFVTELSYKVNQTDIEVKYQNNVMTLSNKSNFSYGRVGLSIGYKFNF